MRPYRDVNAQVKSCLFMTSYLFNSGQQIIDYELLTINDEIYCHFTIRNPGILQRVAP